MIKYMASPDKDIVETQGILFCSNFSIKQLNNGQGIWSSFSKGWIQNIVNQDLPQKYQSIGVEFTH